MSSNSIASLQFNEQERKPLERLFRVTLGYLALLVGGGLALTVYLLRQSPPQDFLLVALATGVIGSATAAFVSVLDRHAKGLEDLHGGATPDPDTMFRSTPRAQSTCCS